MARIDPRQAVLKDGTIVVIRSAVPDDARALVRFTAATLSTSAYLIRTPQEYGESWRAKRRWIRAMEHSAADVALLAVSDGAIVGFLDSMAERRLRVRHNTRFGLAVAARWRGRGVGKALVEVFLGWVSAHPVLSRVELHVHSENAAAIALYRALGFAEEGRRRGAIRYEDGRVMDDVVMGLRLDSFAR